MRQKEAPEKLGPLLKQPSFHAKEAHERGVSSSTLCYYVKAGNLVRVAHGVYSSAKFEVEDGDWQWEDLLPIVRAIPEGVVCLITALRLYDMTEEHSREFWIAAPRTRMPRNLPMVRCKRMSNMELGRTTIMIGGFEVPIFDETRCVLTATQIRTKSVIPVPAHQAI